MVVTGFGYNNPTVSLVTEVEVAVVASVVDAHGVADADGFAAVDGSTLYSSSHAYLFLSWICLVLVCSLELVTCVYESNVLMYYIFLLDDIL